MNSASLLENEVGATEDPSKVDGDFEISSKQQTFLNSFSMAASKKQLHLNSSVVLSDNEGDKDDFKKVTEE